MPPIPLFTTDELRSAFALLLPAEKAHALAARWLEEIGGDDVTADGWFVYPLEWSNPFDDEPTEDPPADEVRAEDFAAWGTPEVVRSDEATFASLTDDDDVERLLLRLGDTHLALAALVSDAAFERLRIVRRMSPRGAARNRLQMERGVRAYRMRRGLPVT